MVIFCGPCPIWLENRIAQVRSYCQSNVYGDIYLDDRMILFFLCQKDVAMRPFLLSLPGNNLIKIQIPQVYFQFPEHGLMLLLKFLFPTD